MSISVRRIHNARQGDRIVASVAVFDDILSCHYDPATGQARYTVTTCWGEVSHACPSKYRISAGLLEACKALA